MEDIPAPILITPSENEKILSSNTFKIESDKKNAFEITISRTLTKIVLEGKSNIEIESLIYYSQKSIEELKENKYFLMFDNLTEIYDEIINLIKNNNPQYIEDNNKLIISIPVSTTKIKEIILEMNKKEKTDKEKINELYSIIYNLKSYFTNQINELSAKIEKQNIKIIELQKKLEEKNKSEANIIKNVDNNIDIFKDSIIINNNMNYISNLKKWISPDNKFFTTKLLFRKSLNGDSFEEFHKLCDHKGKTLVLIQAEEGFIIGGYTTHDWDISEKWYYDNDSFLFSLTKGQIFEHKKNMVSILGKKNCGPWFAYIGFRCFGKQNLSGREFLYKNEEESSFKNYEKIIPNEKKNRNFNVIEVEIYQINK